MDNDFRLVAAPFTPFRPDGSLHLEIIEGYARSLHENGVNGVFIGGTTGESTSLTIEERMWLAQRWKEVCGDDLAVIVHVGSDCLAHACALARHAREIGAAAIGALAPVFFKPATAGELVDFLAPVAGSAPQLPFYYYHFPGMTGSQVSAVALMAQARKRIPNFAGVKFTDYDMPDFQGCVEFENGRFEALFGRDERLLDGLRAGAGGAVGSTYNFAASHARRIVAAFREGDEEQAQRLQTIAVEYINVIFNEFGGLPAAKAFMKYWGVDCGPVRLPLKRFDDSLFDSMLASLESIGFPFAVRSTEPVAV